MRFLFLIIFIPAFANAQINPAYIFKSNLGYAKLETSGDGMFGFEKDGKFGYMDKTEKVIIPATYSYESTYSGISYFTKGYVKLKNDGKYGILDKTGKIVVPFDYDYLYVSPTLNGYATVGKKDGSKTSYGVISLQNKVVIPLQYEDISSDSNLFAFKQGGKWGLFDLSGKALLPFDYPSLTPYAKYQLVRYEKDGKFIFIDTKGKTIFEKAKNVYTLYSPIQGMILCTVNSKYGFLDLAGNETIITKYDYGYGFESNGLAKMGKKIPGSTYSYYYGYIDKKGNEVIPLKYESLGTFSNGLVIAKDPETNRYGYLDKTGKWVIKPVYLDGLGFDDFGGAWVKMTDGKFHYINKSGKDFGAFNETTYKSFNKEGYAIYENTDYPYALIDKNGKVITKIDDCDGIYNFSESIAGYKSKSTGKYGFVDFDGKKIIASEYDGFTGFVEGVSKVDKTTNGKTLSGYIDNKGNIIAPVVYESAYVFRSGWGLIKKDGNYFFVDKSGTLKDPPRKYDELTEFRSGFALGKIKGTGTNAHTYYYINTQLKEEFSFTAWQAYPFWENVAVVSRDDKTYELMNKKGEFFKTLSDVDYLKFSNEGLLAVRQKGKWGFVNDKGDMMITPKYDSCDSFKYGFAKVKMGSKWGIIDKSGTEIIEPKFDNIYLGENGVFIYYDKFWKIIDKTGKVTDPGSISTITTFEKDRALARLGKTYTILKSPLAK
ncbi:MAG: WG repeat-containing protein [Bacteroidota bacterium]